MTGPLDGIRVIELARVMAGPFCGLVLANLGAEVIKVEAPGKGDLSRGLGMRLGGVPEMTTWFAMLNYTKKSVSLNLRSDKGKEILGRLVAQSDVVVENYRPGTLAEMGLAYDRLKTINPRIILASISGFGQTGPYSRMLAHDQTIQAMSGHMSLTGEPEGPPLRSAAAMGDYLAGLYTAVGILAAIRERERTGVGQVIDVALYDALLSTIEDFLTRYLQFGYEVKRMGNRRATSAPTTVFFASDGSVYIVTPSDDHWRRLAQAVGRPELADEARFRTTADRLKHVDGVENAVQSWMAKRTVSEVCRVLDAHRVPCAPVRSIPEVAQDAHLSAREMILELEHPVAGKMLVPGLALKMPQARRPDPTPPPLIGENNVAVFGGLLGYAEPELDELHREGVI